MISQLPDIHLHQPSLRTRHVGTDQVMVILICWVAATSFSRSDYALVLTFESSRTEPSPAEPTLSSSETTGITRAKCADEGNDGARGSSAGNFWEQAPQSPHNRQGQRGSVMRTEFGRTRGLRRSFFHREYQRARDVVLRAVGSRTDGVEVLSPLARIQLSERGWKWILISQRA